MIKYWLQPAYVDNLSIKYYLALMPASQAPEDI